MNTELKDLTQNFEKLCDWIDNKESGFNPFEVLFQLFRNIWMETPPDEIHIRFVIKELAEESKLTEKEIPLLMNIIMPLYNSIAKLQDAVIPIMDTEEYDEVFVEKLHRQFEPSLLRYSKFAEEMEVILIAESEIILEEADRFLDLEFDWKTFREEEELRQDEMYNPFNYGYEEGYFAMLASTKNEYQDEEEYHDPKYLWSFFIPVFTAAQMMDKLRRDRLIERMGM